MPKLNNEIEIIELTEENIGSMVYTIRGVKVMLDFDLARIYGYETRDFNNQIKHNIERFDEDFMFRLTKEEMADVLRWKKSTANPLSSKRRYTPYAFTEQGIYMLMTVLKGDLAVEQSKALIRLFKKMKDYIGDSRDFMNFDSMLINNKFSLYDKRFETIENKLDAVMNNFVDTSTHKHFLIINGERIEAKIAYQVIYSLAKQSVYIIDDYIGIKTLKLLEGVNKELEIIIFSDNAAKPPISDEDIKDAEKEYGLKITLKPTNSTIHDRYIFLDYGTPNEKLYHSGASSKDAGHKSTSIYRLDDSGVYHALIDPLLK